MLEKLLSLFTFYKIMDFSELDAVVSNGAPHQLAKIVEQAHRHERFSTFPPITVSGEMRGRLMYPLTQQQVLDIAATTYPCDGK